MVALEVIGGLLFFVPAFTGLGLGVGHLSEKHHTGAAMALLYAGIAALLAAVIFYGRLVR